MTRDGELLLNDAGARQVEFHSAEEACVVVGRNKQNCSGCLKLFCTLYRHSNGGRSLLRQIGCKFAV